MPEQPVHVAVAVIRNAENEILIAKRPDDVHQGGLWEFPGGKVEPGEDTRSALCRELQEELGITVLHSVPLISINHHYPDKHVYLDVHEVKSYRGEATGLEGQETRWVASRQLDRYVFPRANKNILNRVQLPQEYLITGDYPSAKEFEQRLVNALEHGIQLVQYRDHNRDKKEYSKQAKIALSICQDHAAKLILNADASVLHEVNADGIHFTTEKLMQLSLSELPENTLFSASVHNAQQLQQANTLDLDFVVISPVLPTLTHPGGTALGWDKLKDLIQQANMPVYALGGMQAEHTWLALKAGAQGIAAIRSIWEHL